MKNIPGFYPRLLMFTILCALTVYLMHFLLPGGPDKVLGDVQLNPIAQIGLFVILSLAGGLVAFWITFGDALRQQGK